ncbi:MAG: M48 family metallopeptidase [Rubellimicrobium sp.]|nr:M48 family metallopeptidase [Rubellimicrobium sp.]
MLRLTPILLALIYGFVAWRFSAWRTRAELDARSAELLDPALAPVFGRMAGALGLPRLKVHLYDIEPVNGLAAPDGRIFITRGLYDRFRSGAVSAEEIASVIAHELGHVALGHARRRGIDFSGQNAARVALAAVLGRFLPGLGPMVASFAADLLAKKMSRKDEHEADAYATALLMKAGIGAEAQVSLLAKLDRMAGGGQPPAWISTHPPSRERIARIEANSRRWTVR